MVGFFCDHLDLVFMFHPKLKVCILFDECWWEKKKRWDILGCIQNLSIWFHEEILVSKNLL